MATQFMKYMEDKRLRIKTKVDYAYWLTSRTKKYVFVFFFVLSHCVCFGQDIRNSSNMLVGKIEANGIVRDCNNMTVGKIETDGDVRDRNNMLVGKIERNGTVRDRNNMTMGRIEADGTVRHRNKLEKSKEEGDNFLKKAIAALNDYTQ